MAISVVIPARNAKPTIARAIRSVSKQNPRPLEIIVVDNASTDGTGELLAGGSFGPTPLRVIRLEVDRGPAYSLRVGFEAARGSWVAYCDADDSWCQGRLQNVMRYADRHDIVADNLLLVGEGQPRQAAFLHGGPVDLLYYLAATRHPGRGPVDLGFLKPMVRREWVERYPLPLERYGPDWLWTVQMLEAGARMWLTEDATYEYTIRPDSVSRAPDPDRALIMLRVVEQAYELCSDPIARRLLRERARWLQPSADLAVLRHAAWPQARLAALGRLLANPTAWKKYSPKLSERLLARIPDEEWRAPRPDRVPVRGTRSGAA